MIEHACEPNNEAKAGSQLQVQGQLDGDALSQPPYPEEGPGEEGDVIGVSCASSQHNDSLFILPP